MKRLWMVLLPVLFTLACTGTKEPPLKLLLAVGEDERVVFYPAGTEAAAAVGAWNVGASVLDLVRPAGEPRLWVLTPSELRIYPLTGSRADRAPDAASPEATLDLGGVCDGGRLTAGEHRVLLDCGSLGVWTVPAAAPALEPVATDNDPAGTRYLLGPDDRVVRLRPGLQRFTLVYPNPPDDPLTFEVDLDEDPATLAGAWRDGLLGVAVGRLSDVALYEWRAASADAPARRPPELALTGARGLWSLPDGWLLIADGAYAVRRKDRADAKRSGDFRDATVTPDAYIYLVGHGRMVVLDLLDPNLSEHVRSLGGSAAAVDYLPTDE